MNLSIKQKETHREQAGGCHRGGEVGEGWNRSLALVDATIIYRMDKQQGPTVQHKELYSISCDKPQWKRI